MVDRFYWKLVWILTGFFFAIAGSLMWISGTVNLHCFYDVGRVYDVPQANLPETWNDTSVKSFSISDKHGGWKYMIISFSDVSEDSFDARLEFYDTDGVLAGQMNACFKDGSHLLEIPAEQFDRMDMVMENLTGLSFHVDNLQFREQKPVFSVSRFVTYLLALWTGFLLVTGILCRLLKNRLGQVDWYAPVRGLQEIFLYVGKGTERLNGRFSQRQKSYMRSGLFCFMLLFMQVGLVLHIYATNSGYRYLAFLCVLSLLGIGFLCREESPRRLNWDNKLAVSWFGLWVLTMVSDFVVVKRYAYLGYVMIFVMGFLFFMWGNMKHREWLIKDFIRGIQWSFLPDVLFCWLFRPVIPGYRYTGFTHRPGYSSMYLLFVWFAFLADIEFDLREKKVLRKDFLCLAALGICGNLLWKSQSISSLLPAALAILIFSLKFWLNRKEFKLWAVPVFLAVFLMGVFLNGYCVYHVPRMLHTEIKFKDDFYMDTVTEHPFILTVQAAEEGNENRLLYKLKMSKSLETLTSGRTLFWKAFLRGLNLWGHKNEAYFLGGHHLPHNGLIAIMYRYGIFAAVPYILMLIWDLLYAFKYFWRHLFDSKKYGFFVLCDMLSCAWLLLVENLELPLLFTCWYGMYIIMGVYFDDEKCWNQN